MAMWHLCCLVGNTMPLIALDTNIFLVDFTYPNTQEAYKKWVWRANSKFSIRKHRRDEKK